MTVIKLNKKAYQSRMHVHGIGGHYTKVLRQSGSGIGYGIVDSMGKEATKYVLGGLGKSSGSYAGKQLGRLIQEKSGSEFLGKVAKSALSSLGGLAGQQVGKLSGKLLGDTVFSDKEKEKEKKKKEAPKVSLSELLDQARTKVGLQSGNGINLIW